MVATPDNTRFTIAGQSPRVPTLREIEARLTKPREMCPACGETRALRADGTPWKHICRRGSAGRPSKEQ